MRNQPTTWTKLQAGGRQSAPAAVPDRRTSTGPGRSSKQTDDRGARWMTAAQLRANGWRPDEAPSRRMALAAASRRCTGGQRSAAVPRRRMVPSCSSVQRGSRRRSRTKPGRRRERPRDTGRPVDEHLRLVRAAESSPRAQASPIPLKTLKVRRQNAHRPWSDIIGA